MKIRVLLLFVLLFPAYIQAQTIGNEWIDYDLTYFKIKTGTDEFHRISFASVLNAIQQSDPNATLGEVIPENIRLYHRGAEVAIDLVGMEDGTFDPTDHIEFYGRKNDGVQDKELFYREQDQVHPYYNLFSDTTAFFLTLEGNDPGGGLRMRTSDVDPSGLPVVNTHREELLEIETNNFSFGQYWPIGNINGEVKRSLYDRGQMFTSREIMNNEYGLANQLNYADFAIDGISLRDEAFGKPELTVQIVGLNNTIHNTTIFIGPNTSELSVFRDEIQLNYSNFGEVTQQFEWDQIVSGRLIVRVEEVSFPEIADSRVAVSYTRLNYPQFIDAQSQSKRINLYGANSNNNVQVSNVDGEVALYDLTDYRNPVKIPHTRSGNNISAAVENDLDGRNLYLRKNDELIEATVEPVTFKFQDLSAHNYYIISHPFLKQAVDGSDDPVQSYVDYRESAAGGGYNVGYANAPDLYDEFGYGEFTPLAIRRYMQKAYNEGDPEYLFIIGKSSRVDIQTQRSPDPLAGSRPELVPTLGAPGSDLVYTEGFDGRDHVPAFPVGRLSITQPIHVMNYLNKVIEKERTIKNSPWTKNFVQLSGGLSTSELVRFTSIIDNLKDIAQDDYLGANVNNISKQTNNAVQTFNIADEINRGTGFVFFFGHSSASFTDIDIGFVSDPSNGYNNLAKYPAFLVNGCRGGEIFYYNSFGEDWLRTADKGAVNFIAHSDVGITSYLNEYSEHMYDVMTDTLWITKSIGEIQKETIIRQLNGFSPDETDFAMVEQNVLQGDPAIPIFGHDKVDYAISTNDIFIQSVNDKPVNASTPFFNLGIVVNNGGRTSDDSVSVNVRREISDGTTFELPEIKVPPIRYQDTIYYEISNQGLDVFGANSFTVVLDIENNVDEGNKLNNIASFEFFLSSSGTFNTSPYNYETLQQTEIELVVQSADLKLNDKVFQVELDTTNRFDSPFLQTTTLSGKGIGRWNVSLLPPTTNDTIQYYWRSVFEDELTEDPVPWSNSTFTYIRDGNEGWGQTEFDQFEDLSLSSLAKAEDADEWIFAGSETDFEIITFGSEHPNGGQPNLMTVEINGQSMFASGSNRTCQPNSINAIAFDKDSGRPYLILRTPGIDFDILDPLNCGVTPQLINRFTDDYLRDIDVLPADDLMTQYVDGMDDGDYGLFFSNGGLNYSAWRSNVFDQLGRVGASVGLLEGTIDGAPLIVFGRKGFPQGTADLVRGVPVGDDDETARQAEISYDNTIFASTDSGTVFSPFIGPASQWGTLYQTVEDDPGEDVWTFEVRGRSLNGDEVVLFPDVTAEELDLSSIDPNIYPFVRLYINMVDKISATPAQLQRWLVSYQGVPEGIISLQNDENENVKLQEGEPFEAAFKFTNISEYDFQGPLNVRYTFTNQDSGQEETSSIQIPALAAGETADFVLPIQTSGGLGFYNLEVFVNPGDEIEQYYSNNRIFLEGFYEVVRDEVSPAMDVTFDGIYIMDGDVVSARPLIQLELRDNNIFKFKTDTAGVELFLRQDLDGTPAGGQVFFSDPNLNFTPASENQNYTVQYTPQEMEDGNYILEARMTDASGNLAGNDYRISFEVVNESTVTNFYPYPNPFSTSVRFVFTLTGSEIPDRVKIQIFTVSGRLVREITQDEIGPIKIGNNITEYAWDGRDEFGDQLANGTYLYRVQLGSSIGSSFKGRATKGDKGFDNGFGKLVILR